MWTKSFSAKCTDASQQRYLKAKPEEKIECTIKFSHRELTTELNLFQITTDFNHPVADISQMQYETVQNNQKEFSLTAPRDPGLYMIWCQDTLHFGFRAAEECYPTNYEDAESWYDNFIAWLRVDKKAQKQEPGKTAKMF